MASNRPLLPFGDARHLDWEPYGLVFEEVEAPNRPPVEPAESQDYQKPSGS